MSNSKLKFSIRNIQKFYKNRLVIKYNLETLDISDGIDWNFKHPDNPQTYQVYLHSLHIVKDFVLVGVEKNDKEAFKSAHDFIMNWYHIGQSTDFSWHEHAVSSRIINIVNFQEKARAYKLPENIFQKIILKHSRFLNKEKNYKHNNHGLMMDNALLRSSAYLENVNYKLFYTNKALYRIRTSIHRDLTKQGLHIENSPEYHNLYISLLNQIFSTLNKRDIQLERSTMYLKEAAIAVRRDLIKPNNEFPLIGDTSQAQYDSIEKTFNDIVDLDAGLVVLQNEKPKKKTSSRYFTFKSGYLSKTHKHYDDLSVTYYNNGHDVLIDPGKYSYNKNDLDRLFLTSPQSHSSISVDNELYPLLLAGQQNKNNLKITKYFYTKSYHFVEGTNNLFSDVTLTRKCVITSEDDLIIIDRGRNARKKNILLTFNINEHAKISTVEQGVSLSIEKEKYLLQLYKPSSDTSFEIKNGIVSKKFGVKVPNKYIQFKQSSKDICFVSFLKNIKSKTELLNVDEDSISIKLNNKVMIIPI